MNNLENLINQTEELYFNNQDMKDEWIIFLLTPIELINLRLNETDYETEI